MKRALITGITGQDGSHLAELLLWKGYEVWKRLPTCRPGRHHQWFTLICWPSAESLSSVIGPS